MKKTEVLLLVQKIDALYPGRLKMDDPKIVINAWYEILKDSNFEKSNDKLMRYVKENKFPPTVSDLIAEEQKKTPEQLEHERVVEEMKKRLNA